jgi:uncharacterized coiled-coil DUF342 family protein
MTDNDTPKNKSTVEIYKDLIYVEVRSLINRVTDITGTIESILREMTALALQTEEHSQKVKQNSIGLDYCRKEIKRLKEELENIKAKSNH